MAGRTSKVFSDRVLGALLCERDPVTSAEVARLVGRDMQACSRVLKSLYDEGLVSRVYEKRRRELFGASRKINTLCYKLTPQGIRSIEVEHANRISHESGPEKIQSPRDVSGCNPDGDDRTHGLAGGGPNEPQGAEPESATDGAG